MTRALLRQLQLLCHTRRHSSTEHAFAQVRPSNNEQYRTPPLRFASKARDEVVNKGKRSQRSVSTCSLKASKLCGNMLVHLLIARVAKSFLCISFAPCLPSGDNFADICRYV